MSALGRYGELYIATPMRRLQLCAGGLARMTPAPMKANPGRGLFLRIVTASAAQPTREMRDAGNIVCDRVFSVPAFGQVLLERINVWPSRPISKTIDVDV